MKKICLLFTLSICALVLKNAPEPIVTAQEPFQKGVTYTTWPVGKFGTSDADLVLDNITAIGADWIALIVTKFQDDLDTTTIYPTTETATDAELIHAINMAHEVGLKVMFKPHLDPLVTTATHWRGMIGQDFTEADWHMWFNNYLDFITHYAAIAEANDVEQFCVGVELSTSATQRESDWRSIITAVRAIYHGPITYAALNSNEVIDIAWWDAVDYIGVDIYNGLGSDTDPTVDELKIAWQPHVDKLANLSASWNKSILITEIGYMSQDGTIQHPWNWLIEDGIVDLQEQVIGYQAAFEVLYHQPWLAGIYWWDYGTDPFEGGPCDQRYTPNDKPAEDILRQWYGADPPAASRNVMRADNSQILTVYTDTLSTGWVNQSIDIQADLLSTAPVFSGTYAISATAQVSGALVFQHAGFNTDPYAWLDFYVMKPSIGEDIRVFVTDEDSNELRYLPLCRYMTGAIEPYTWKRIRIPMSDLDVHGNILQKISFKNVTNQTHSFWLDEIRLVAPVDRIFLPCISRQPDSALNVNVNINP